MSKIVCFLIILLTLNTVFSQPLKNKVIDTITKKSGDRTELIITNSSYKTKKIVRLKNGKLDGFQEEYSRNEVLAKKSEYKDGFLNGTTFTYDNQGKLTEERPFVFKKDKNHSVIEGMLKSYRNDILLSEFTYKDSLKNGDFKEFNNNGNLSVNGSYKQNLLFGKYEKYHPNEILNLTCNYEITNNEKGKPIAVLHGKFKEYTNTDVLCTEGNYNLGKKEGLWKTFNRNSGTLETEINYKNDKIHGINNKYDASGKLISRAIFYAEIEVNGSIQKNIYDGKHEEFNSKGLLRLSETYNMGKKVGIFQRFSDEGVLVEQGNYINNLKIGLWVTYDEKGIKNHEITYKIIQEKDKEKSVEDGADLQWYKGVLIRRSTFVNGKENGLIETFYPNGKPEKVTSKTNGVPDNEYTEFYENGNIKYQSKALIIPEQSKDTTGVFKRFRTDYFNENAQLISQVYNLKNQDDQIVISYQNEKPIKYEVPKLLSLYSFPNADVMSFKFYTNYRQPLVGVYFYQNKKIRKLIYQDPSSLKENQIVFNDEGQYQHEFSDYYSYFNKEGQLQSSNSDTDNSKALKGNEEVKKAYIVAINPDWSNSKLFTDKVKNGKYVLEYTNKKSFLEMEFKDNLPHGKTILFEPIKGDTLLFKNYNYGVLTGKLIEKFAGKTTVRRANYYENGQVAEELIVFKDGKRYEKNNYDSKGKRTQSESYHTNGQLNTKRDETNKTYSSYDNNGLLIEQKKLISTDGNWSELKQYHKNSAVLKSESFYFKEQTDSIFSQFYENGKLQYRTKYKAGKRNGSYVNYFESGQLKTKGQYENDLMEGSWLSYSEKGEAKSMFYKNGKLQVAPTLRKCQCIDTLYSNNKLRFAPLLKNLVESDVLRKYIPAFLKPIDNLNYDSIFYINLQISTGTNSGFASLKLLLFKPLSFYLPSNNQLKITLNPCKTEGYISTIETTANYVFDEPKQTSASLYPQRIALELIDSPLKSNDKDFENFTGLYDVDRIDLNYKEQFSINFKKEDKACYTSAKINDYLFIEISKAKPMIFEQPDFYFLNQNPLKKEEMDRFFGFKIQEAALTFDLLEQNKTIKINATTEQIYAGGKLATGRVLIPCKKVAEDSYEISNGATKQLFTSQNLKKEWLKNGFTRITTNYNQDQSQLELSFFAE